MNLTETMAWLKNNKSCINLSKLFSYEPDLSATDGNNSILYYKIIDYIIMFYGIKHPIGKVDLDSIARIDIVAHNSIIFFFEMLERYEINTFEAYLMLDGLMMFDNEPNIISLGNNFVKLPRISIIDLNNPEYNTAQYKIFRYTDLNFNTLIGIDVRINMNKYPANRLPPEFTSKLEKVDPYKGTLKED